MSQSATARTRQRWRRLVLSALLAAQLATGCRGLDEKKLSYIGGEREVEYYEDVATRIEYADVNEPTPDNVVATTRPRTIAENQEDEIWELTLAEAIQLAIANNKIIRSRNEFLTSGQLFNNAGGVSSVYDAALRESGVLFGNRGVESALSAFDPTFTSSVQFGHNANVQNNSFLGPGTGNVLSQNTGQFQSGLTKAFGYGATVGVTHNWNYTSTNQQFLTFPSSYTGTFGFNYQQPLWAGSGAEFTRTAGPVGTNLVGVSGVNQGVSIARINTDITIADFEISVRNMLRDVEDLYWELYLAYRTYDSQVIARNSALRSWREAETKRIVGTKGGSAADEAQAREQYYNSRAQSEDALQNLNSIELQLRRMMGLPASDGKIIRPKDEPMTAEYLPEWHTCLAEALTRREELRRQKWNVKSLELQLAAAKNLANPRLDFVSSYTLNGFGHRLFGQDDFQSATVRSPRSAYGNLLAGNQTGWGLGLQFSMPLGLRNSLAQVRNQELQLVKSRQVLATQELEVSHELSNSVQTLAWRYKTAQTQFNRRLAAERQVRAAQTEFEAGQRTLDFVLRAQAGLAQAEIAYYTSLIRYNQAATDLHFRKGTLLENNNVHLSESLWTPDAYKDAWRRAWARTYAIPAFEKDPVWNEPAPFVSEGTVGQTGFIGHAPPAPGVSATPEAGPTPADGFPSDVPPEPSSTETLLPESRTLPKPEPTATRATDRETVDAMNAETVRRGSILPASGTLDGSTRRGRLPPANQRTRIN